MKALVNRIIRDRDNYYRLKKGEEAPPLPEKEEKRAVKAGLIEKPPAPIKTKSGATSPAKPAKVAENKDVNRKEENDNDPS